MSLPIFTCTGGQIVLPPRNLVLTDRASGGNLIVNPPRKVWERSELSAEELMLWSFLVAATGRAMLEVLPQLADGCINYWEAGNWALHDAATPSGPKTAPAHRRVHLHLLGRSRTATDAAWPWGEAPAFPAFADRFAWAAQNQRLTATECQQIVARTETLLQSHYNLPADQLTAWSACHGCAYPLPQQPVRRFCAECNAAEAKA